MSIVWHEWMQNLLLMLLFGLLHVQKILAQFMHLASSILARKNAVSDHLSHPGPRMQRCPGPWMQRVSPDPPFALLRRPPSAPLPSQASLPIATLRPSPSTRLPWPAPTASLRSSSPATTAGSAVGFRLDSLLKLADTRARNNKMTLMHYLCKVTEML